MCYQRDPMLEYLEYTESMYTYTISMASNI